MTSDEEGGAGEGEQVVDGEAGGYLPGAFVAE
jgi:hypothetical protein